MVEGSIELGICIDGCLNSEYSGDHPSFPRVLCHQTPPPSGSPMDLDEQDVRAIYFPSLNDTTQIDSLKNLGRLAKMCAGTQTRTG